MPPSRRSLPLPSGLLLALLLACPACGRDSTEPEGLSPGAPDAAPPQRTARFTLRVAQAALPPSRSPLGPLRLLAEEQSTGETRRRLIDLRPSPRSWPATFEIDLDPGRYRLTVFHDRADDGAFDSCPFPPAPDDPQRADEFDNLSASGAFEIPVAAGEIMLLVERHICGPGDNRTGISGTVRLPGSVAEQEIVAPLLVRLLPSLAADPSPADAGLARAPLIVPLFPDGLGRAERMFELGELLPGTYEATFFLDSDRDGQLSACGPGVGGGDRYLKVREDLVVVAGERTDVGQQELGPPPGCSGGPTTEISGTISLAAPLLDALAERPELAADLGSMSGPLRLALFEIGEGGALVETVTLQESLLDPPLPRPFTVTGVQAGERRLVIYVDRDDDQQFAPCGGHQGGLDGLFWTTEVVDLAPGRVTELGAVQLVRADDCDPEASGIRGEVRIELEQGEVLGGRSGRPVRLALYPESEAAERRDLLLFENHRALPAGPDEATTQVRFTVAGDLMPGRYGAQVFVDTDRDGTYTSCLDAPYADRLTSELVHDVVIESGRLVDLGLLCGEAPGCDGALRVEPQGCPIPPGEIAPRIYIADDIASLQPSGPLSIEMREAGGERRTFSDVEQPPVELPPFTVAPGQYTVTARLIPVQAELAERCQQPGAELTAQVQVTIDQESPAASPALILALICPL